MSLPLYGTCNHSRDLSIAGMYIHSRQHLTRTPPQSCRDRDTAVHTNTLSVNIPGNPSREVLVAAACGRTSNFLQVRNAINDWLEMPLMTD